MDEPEGGSGPMRFRCLFTGCRKGGFDSNLQISDVEDHMFKHLSYEEQKRICTFQCDDCLQKGKKDDGYILKTTSPKAAILKDHKISTSKITFCSDYVRATNKLKDFTDRMVEFIRPSQRIASRRCSEVVERRPKEILDRRFSATDRQPEEVPGTSRARPLRREEEKPMRTSSGSPADAQDASYTPREGNIRLGNNAEKKVDNILTENVIKLYKEKMQSEDNGHQKGPGRAHSDAAQRQSGTPPSEKLMKPLQMSHPMDSPADALQPQPEVRQEGAQKKELWKPVFPPPIPQPEPTSRQEQRPPMLQPVPTSRQDPTSSMDPRQAGYIENGNPLMAKRTVSPTRELVEKHHRKREEARRQGHSFMSQQAVSSTTLLGAGDRCASEERRPQPRAVEATPTNDGGRRPADLPKPPPRAQDQASIPVPPPVHPYAYPLPLFQLTLETALPRPPSDVSSAEISPVPPSSSSCSPPERPPPPSDSDASPPNLHDSSSSRAPPPPVPPLPGCPSQLAQTPVAAKPPPPSGLSSNDRAALLPARHAPSLPHPASIKSTAPPPAAKASAEPTHGRPAQPPARRPQDGSPPPHLAPVSVPSAGRHTTSVAAQPPTSLDQLNAAGSATPPARPRKGPVTPPLPHPDSICSSQIAPHAPPPYQVAAQSSSPPDRFILGYTASPPVPRPPAFPPPPRPTLASSLPVELHALPPYPVAAQVPPPPVRRHSPVVPQPPQSAPLRAPLVDRPAPPPCPVSARPPPPLDQDPPVCSAPPPARRRSGPVVPPLPHQAPAYVPQADRHATPAGQASSAPVPRRLPIVPPLPQPRRSSSSSSEVRCQSSAKRQSSPLLAPPPVPPVLLPATSSSDVALLRQPPAGNQSPTAAPDQSTADAPQAAPTVSTMASDRCASPTTSSDPSSANSVPVAASPEETRPAERLRRSPSVEIVEPNDDSSTPFKQPHLPTAVDFVSASLWVPQCPTPIYSPARGPDFDFNNPDTYPVPQSPVPYQPSPAYQQLVDEANRMMRMMHGNDGQFHEQPQEINEDHPDNPRPQHEPSDDTGFGGSSDVQEHGNDGQAEQDNGATESRLVDRQRRQQRLSSASADGGHQHRAEEAAASSSGAPLGSRASGHRRRARADQEDGELAEDKEDGKWTADDSSSSGRRGSASSEEEQDAPCSSQGRRRGSRCKSQPKVIRKKPWEVEEKKRKRKHGDETAKTITVTQKILPLPRGSDIIATRTRKTRANYVDDDAIDKRIEEYGWSKPVPKKKKTNSEDASASSSSSARTSADVTDPYVIDFP